jgi:exodeoxyribonuclease VII small subunit
VNEEEKIDFERNLTELENIVDELEDEHLNLDRSIELFEEGVKLAEEIQTGLSEAKLRLKKVIENSELDFEAEDFDL